MCNVILAHLPAHTWDKSKLENQSTCTYAASQKSERFPQCRQIYIKFTIFLAFVQ